MTGWWLDELGHAGDEHLDEDYVATYDRKAGFDPTEDVETLTAHGLESSSKVIDLGAGTGRFSLAVAPRCAQVIAVDVSPAMTSVLRAAVDAAGLTNVSVVEAGFLSYRHDGPPVDAVYTRHALHQLPDFWKAIALERIAAMLQPGGILRLRDLIFDFEPAQTDERIEAWLAGAASEPAVGWTAPELAAHVQGEYSTFSWLFEAILERTGFEIVDRRYVRSAYGAYTCRKT